MTFDPQALVSAMPFSLGIGIELEAASPEEVRGRLAWALERCTVNGAIHGGALMALGDSLGAVCAFLNLPAGASTSTIESKTNFFARCAPVTRTLLRVRCTWVGPSSWFRPTSETTMTSELPR